MGPVKVDDEVQEIRTEQEYFDHAMDAHLGMVARYDQQLHSEGTAAERRALKAQAEKITKLGFDDAVALMSVEMEDGDQLYLGRTAIFDENSDLLVVNWRQEAAAKFYQATPDDPQGVVRKRDFKTDGNRIKSFKDIILAQLSADIAELEDGFQKPSDSLLESLTETRSGAMRDIVGTIQAAQDKILRTTKDALLVVQGGPGTGKTAVALHRASWLLYNYAEELPPEEVLVVGPNPAFIRYIKEVLPDLGDHSVRQTSISDMLQRTLKIGGVDSDNVAKIKGSSMMQDIIATGLDDRIKAPTGPVRLRRRNSATSINLPPGIIAEDIKEFRAQYYGPGRELFKTRVLERAAEQLGRRGGADIASIVDPRSLDSEVNKMWPQLSAVQFIRELLGSKQRLRRAARDHLESAEAELLYRQPAERINDEPWTAADLALIDEAASFMQDRQETFGHIVVDEAQDLTPMQLSALRRRSKSGSMTIVGDLAQSTGPFARDSWDDIIQDLKSNAKVVTAELEYGYRVPREVFSIAERVLKMAAPELTPPKIVRGVGHEPVLHIVASSLLPAEVARIASQHSGHGRFVGVIAPSEMWEDITAAFDEVGVQWGDAVRGAGGRAINLVTPEASKGLEFDAVVLVGPQSIIDQDHGARLLYIAMTRTTNYLEVVAPLGEIPDVLRNAFTYVNLLEDTYLEPQVDGATAETVTDSATDAAQDGQNDQAGAETASSSEEAHDSNQDASENGARTSVPTPRDLVQSTAKTRAESAAEVLRDAAEAERGVNLNAVQAELVHRNAQYLAEIVRDSFGPALRLAVLHETLSLLGDDGSES